MPLGGYNRGHLFERNSNISHTQAQKDRFEGFAAHFSAIERARTPSLNPFKFAVTQSRCGWVDLPVDLPTYPCKLRNIVNSEMHSMRGAPSTSKARAHRT
jgi:hypothetical protein